MIIKQLLLIFAVGALLAFIITPYGNPIEFETLSGNYTYNIDYNDGYDIQIQKLTFYPNQTWNYEVDGHSDYGKYVRIGKKVNITGKRFIREEFRILKNKSLRDSVGRVWIKTKLYT